jgi:hypothetical protein
MFILAIVQQFEIYHKNPANPMLLIDRCIEDVCKAWVGYCSAKRQKKLKVSDLLFFLKLLGAPLGLAAQAEFFEGARKFYRMSLIAYYQPL